MVRWSSIVFLATVLLTALPAASFAADVIFQLFARERYVQEGDRDFCLDRDAEGSLVTRSSFTDELSCESAGYVWADEARRGRLGFGDLWRIRSLDYVFGTKECANYPPAQGGAYCCLRVSGIDFQEAERLVKPLRISDKNIEVEQTRYFVDFKTLPAILASDLISKGEGSVSWDNLRIYIVDKKTGESR